MPDKLDIVDRETEVREDTIAVLEEALVWAKSGKMVEVMIVAVLDNDNTFTNSSSTLSFRERMGCLEILKFNNIHGFSHEDD